MDNMANLRDFVKNGRKILATAINYKASLKKANLPMPSAPMIFMKPTSAYVTQGQPIRIPENFTVFQETELGVVIGRKCQKVRECEAMDYVGGYCLALDMTAMSELRVARQTGKPWTIGKGFDTSNPVSRFISLEEIKDPHNVELWCKVNGELKVNGNTNDLVFNIPHIIAYISQYITLEPNDVVLTGTPPESTPVKSGDVIEVGIKDLITMKFNVE